MAGTILLRQQFKITAEIFFRKFHAVTCAYSPHKSERLTKRSDTKTFDVYTVFPQGFARNTKILIKIGSTTSLL